MKLQTKIVAGAVTLLVITMALTVPTAIGQTTPQSSTKSDVKPTKLEATDILKGEGDIVDSSGGLLKGHYKLLLVSQGDNNANEQYLVKEGQFIVNNNDFSDNYRVNASSWTVIEAKDGYTASGIVTDDDGKQYKVSLAAQTLQEIKNGYLYVSNGTFSDKDGNKIYELHYIAELVHRNSPLTAS